MAVCDTGELETRPRSLRQNLPDSLLPVSKNRCFQREFSLSPSKEPSSYWNPPLKTSLHALRVPQRKCGLGLTIPFTGPYFFFQSNRGTP